MNKQTKALKDLLEAVEHAIEIGDWKVDGRCDPDLAINRAKEALEQPAQEPVAWMSKKRGDVSKAKMYFNEGEEILPLYTHPAPLQNEFAKTTSWQGLSDAVVMKIVWDLEHITDRDVFVSDFARAIEQALRSKNEQTN